MEAGGATERLKGSPSTHQQKNDKEQRRQHGVQHVGLPVVLQGVVAARCVERAVRPHAMVGASVAHVVVHARPGHVHVAAAERGVVLDELPFHDVPAPPGCSSSL